MIFLLLTRLMFLKIFILHGIWNNNTIAFFFKNSDIFIVISNYSLTQMSIHI